MWRPPLPPLKETQRLQALAASHIMDSPNDPRFDRIAWLARHIYQCDVAFISFIDADTQWVKAWAGRQIRRSWPRAQSICQEIIALNQPIVARDLANDPRFVGHPDLGRPGKGFYIGVPVLLGETLAVGSLCVMSEAPRPGGDIDIEPLQVLASVVADEVELFRHTEELARLARIDPLTGLANRRGLEEGLIRSASRSQRTGESLALVLLDLDGFAEVNERFGRSAGDTLLRAVGEGLAAVELRGGDIVARYDGDEFALILPGADARAAVKVAERVRTTFATIGIRRPDLRRLTASMGVAAQPASVLDIERLVAAASEALYRAKQESRDRIVSAGESAPTGQGPASDRKEA